MKIMSLYLDFSQIVKSETNEIEVYSRDGKTLVKNIDVDLEPMKVQTIDIENYK